MRLSKNVAWRIVGVDAQVDAQIPGRRQYRLPEPGEGLPLVVAGRPVMILQ